MIDFFISYNKADRAWAEWIAWELEESKHSTVIQAWDFLPGSNFVLEMQKATQQAARTVAVLSPDYLNAEYTQPEWAAAFARDPTGSKGLLLPVRVRDCQIEGLLAPVVYIDLYGKSVQEARTALLSGIKRTRVKPLERPFFPGPGAPAAERSMPTPRPFPGTAEPHSAPIAEPVHEGVDSVSDALHALSQMMRDNAKVREAVVEFQTDFQAASQQLHVLSAYKDLHDWLHALQFQCYERILAESRRFPDDESAHDSIADSGMTLRSTLTAVKRAAAGQHLAKLDVQWLVNSLGEADVQLQQALDQSDNRQLNKAAATLRRVLHLYPTQINTRLNEAARTLRLPSLVQAMTVICDTIVLLPLDEDKVQQFQRGVSDLSTLNAELNALISEHDRWQQADGNLRITHLDSGQFMEELDAAWSQLKSLTAPLYERNTEQWAIDFGADSHRLESALAAQDLPKAKNIFRRYRRAAGLRFFEVDVKLKVLCSNLRSVGDPLVSVLKMIK